MSLGMDTLKHSKINNIDVILGTVIVVGSDDFEN